MNLTGKRFGVLIGSIFLLATIPTAILWNKVNRVSKMERFIAKGQKAEVLTLKSVASSIDEVIKNLGEKELTLPAKLAKIPFADQLGIVKKIRKIDLDPIFGPCNGSIVETGDGGYHLVFRYDVSKELWKPIPFHTYIGYAELDANFSVLKIEEKIDTKSRYSEDPRIARVGKDFFIVWNDKIASDMPFRTMHTGKWDPKSCQLEYITNLDQRIKPVEKNWAPFERIEKGVTSLGFVYGILPHKILDLPNPKKNSMMHLSGKPGASKKLQSWQKDWGPLYGGTPARLIGDEYISFFHSWFKDKKKIWYVIGAYTFESKYPYRITSITPYPILFSGIYDTPYMNTADPTKAVIYPAGIAVEKKGDKTLLHVSCGENDCSIKVITFDYEKLRKNMNPIR
jgi:hypothetical protein